PPPRPTAPKPLL
nr:Chain C, TYROSINE-PROTEIN PHOSPHATASE NON-RECEPTOR TYPE 23 [Mus musculus]2W10_D Chain D, TYROSINE-PROTEIN PHOSPHATASE NON-RECEPTOR TYPE 23 [Mus musculus]